MNKKKAASESTIRDRLSENLGILEPGLILLQIERYLPNPKGTRGFIDILAQDSSGKYVLIELKRSDAASREAVQEILKYVEGMKANMALRDDELRVMIVSTEWSELLVPFSALVRRVPLAVAGVNLTVDEDGTPLAAKSVTPLILAQERLFMPVHEISLYRSAQSLLRGKKSYERVCKKKGIDNYVLVELKATTDSRALEVMKVHQAMMSVRAQFDAPPISIDEVVEKLPSYSHMLYFAMLQLDDADCLQRIHALLEHAHPEEREEIESSLSELHSDYRAEELHERLLQLEPWPHRDYLELSNPARFIKVVEDDGWIILNVVRYGTIESNVLLTDETILSELRGEQGVTRQKYARELLGYNSAEINSIEQELEKCLVHNPIWKAHLLTGIRTLSEFSPIARTRISLLNPSNILLSIYMLYAHKQGIRYQPNYSIITCDGDITHMIFGTLEATGETPSLSRIVREYYNNNPGELLFPLSWGGYENRDARIVRDIGLRYCTFRFIDDGKKREFFTLTELGWERCAPIKFMQPYLSYLHSNSEFVTDVCDFFASHWNGFVATQVGGKTTNFRT